MNHLHRFRPLRSGLSWAPTWFRYVPLARVSPGPRNLISLCTVFASMMVPACGRRPPAELVATPAAEPVNVRPVRILLVADDPVVRLRFEDSVVVRGAGSSSQQSDRALTARFNGPGSDRTGSDGAGSNGAGSGGVLRTIAPGRWIEVRAENGRIVLDGAVVGSGPIDISPTTPEGVADLSRRRKGRWSKPNRYAGSLVLSASSGGGVRVVNHVDLETYVACVLPGELFPHFEPEAFVAQAVAVRTFALYHMAERGWQAYDVNASQASQVYPGLPTGAVAQRAREAASRSRGVIATHDTPDGQQIFCTFYSACCGGRTQSVANCRRDVEPIGPLAGGVRCGCMRLCRSEKYRWPPLRVRKAELTAKLVRRYPKLKRLGRVEHLETIRKTQWGRPIEFRLVGRAGVSATILAENLRLAVGSMRLRSSNCKVTESGDSFVFRDGRGFGHGMGLCQWGMQEMALRGFGAAEILKRYYPGMGLTRVY